MGDNRKPPGGPGGPEDGAGAGPAGSPEEAAARRAAAKRQLLETALDKGVVQLRLDARRAGVRVPGNLGEESALALNLSRRFPEIRLVINERGLAASLRFSGARFRCVVPWSALWGMLVPGAESLHVWPPDLPEELGGPPRDGAEPDPLPVEPMKPRLSVIEPVAEPATAPPPEPAPAAKAEAPPPSDAQPAGDGHPKAPWLRVVR